MKKAAAIATLALALVIPAQAQPARPAGGDETPAQQSQIIAAVPTGGYLCGRAAADGARCFSVPANIGGTFWLDAAPTAYTPYGFISFNNVADLGQATITTQTFTSDANHHMLTLHVEFNGMTNDGDNDTYTGTADFTFSYYKMSGGSGRGGGYPGYIQVMQSGTLTINYQ
jgi:hypothetical protein